jgi:hypothetical protein
LFGDASCLKTRHLDKNEFEISVLLILLASQPTLKQLPSPVRKCLD